MITLQNVKTDYLEQMQYLETKHRATKNPIAKIEIMQQIKRLERKIINK